MLRFPVISTISSLDKHDPLGVLRMFSNYEQLCAPNALGRHGGGVCRLLSGACEKITLKLIFN